MEATLSRALFCSGKHLEQRQSLENQPNQESNPRKRDGARNGGYD